jgi:hypothetical protein
MMCAEAEVESLDEAGVLIGCPHAQVAIRTSTTPGKTPACPVTAAVDRVLLNRDAVLDGEDLALLRRELRLFGIVREQSRVLRTSFRQVQLYHGLGVMMLCLFLTRGTDL